MLLSDRLEGILKKLEIKKIKNFHNLIMEHCLYILYQDTELKCGSDLMKKIKTNNEDLTMQLENFKIEANKLFKEKLLKQDKSLSRIIENLQSFCNQQNYKPDNKENFLGYIIAFLILEDNNFVKEAQGELQQDQSDLLESQIEIMKQNVLKDDVNQIEQELKELLDDIGEQLNNELYDNIIRFCNQKQQYEETLKFISNLPLKKSRILKEFIDQNYEDFKKINKKQQTIQVIDQVVDPINIQQAKQQTSEQENIEYLYKILIQNSKESLNQFKEIIVEDKLDLKQIKNFSDEYKFLQKSKQRIDIINQRLKKKFPQIFVQYQSSQLDYISKENYVIGCALYQQLIQDNDIKEINQLAVPNVMKINETNTQKKISIDVLLNIQVTDQDSQSNLNDIVLYLKKIIELKKNQLQNMKEIIENIENIYDSIELMDNQLQIKVKGILQRVAQEEQISNLFDIGYFDNKVQNDPDDQILSQIQFDQAPLEFLQKVIDNPNQYKNINIEELLVKRYYSPLNDDDQMDFDSIISQIKRSQTKDLTIQENMEQVSKYLQSKLDNLEQNNNIELFGCLQKYCQIKIPNIKLKKQISLEDQRMEGFQWITKTLPILENRQQFSIVEFMTIFSDWSVEQELEEIKLQLQQSSQINGEKLIFLLFDFIKRRTRFVKILQYLNEANSNSKFTQVNLFVYMIIHSDDKLRSLLFIACAQFMALPLITFNPWQYNEIPERMVFPQLVNIFEKNKSILQFKFQQDKSKISLKQQSKMQGCSTILNKLFGKDFSLHPYSASNEGTIEIQFDFNNGEPQYLLVADAHGLLEISTLQNIIPIFDYLIIHTIAGHDCIEKIEKELKQFNKKIFVIAHDYKEENLSFQFEEKNNFNVMTIPPKINDSEIFLQSVLKKCFDELKDFYRLDAQDYIANPLLRIANKHTYLDFIKLFLQPNQNIVSYEQSIKLLEELLEMILKQDDFKSLDFLPMQVYVKQLCQNENRLYKDQEINIESTEKIKDQLNKNKKDMLTTGSTKIVNKFKKVIKEQNYIEISICLTKITKAYVENITKPILDERLKFRNIQKKDQSKQVEFEEQLKNLNEKIDSKTFSQEQIMRELYYLSKYSKEQDHNELLIKDFYYQLIQTGQPTELIDGDNLQFIDDIYEKIYTKDDNEDLLVVSVMGPQSSGKSLLMNFIFGTQFLSSAGRCTKGVYCSIIQYKCRKSGKNKKILILDTEGIQSTEARDDQFDKQIVYYILCISHVILLCNKGEMNAPMSEVLKLVADAIVKTKDNFIQNPDIYLIFNMVSETNEQAQLECVTRLQDDLVGINNLNDSMNQVIKITKENIYRLQFAFSTENFGPQKDQVNKPSPFFTDQIVKLRQRILKKFDEDSLQKYTINEWFIFARDFWTFTKSYKNLIEFQTLQQLKDDEKVVQIIDQLTKNKFEIEFKIYLESTIQKHLDEKFAKFEGCNHQPYDVIWNSIVTSIDETYSEINQKIKVEYGVLCQNQSIQKYLIDKRANLLVQKCNVYNNECKISCKNKISSFIEQKSKNVGDGFFNDALNNLLKQNQQYTTQNAETKFEEVWEEAKKNISKVIQKDADIYDSIYNEIKQDFSFNTVSEKYNVDVEKQLLKFYRDNNNFEKFCEQIKDIMKQNDTKQSIIYFIGDQRQPNIQRILDFQDQKKVYLTDYFDNIFYKENIYIYYDSRKTFNQQFKKNNFCQEIIQILKQGLENKWKQFWNKTIIYQNNPNNVKSIQDLTQKFQKECELIGIKFKGYYDDFIPSEEFQKLQFKINPKINQEQIIQLKIQNIIDDDSKFARIENFIPNQNQYLKYFCIFNVNIMFEKCDSQINKNEKNLIKVETQIELLNKSPINQKYFNYLKDPSKSPTQMDKQKTYDLFFQNLNWKIIFQDIEKEVIKNYSKNQQYLGKSVDEYIQNLKINNQNIESEQLQFCKFDKSITKLIIIGVKQIIEKIDYELEKYCLKIKQDGIYWINLIAQILTTRLSEQLEIIKQSRPLIDYEKRKDHQQKIFVAKLTCNNQIQDEGLGEQLAFELIEFHYKRIVDINKDIFRQIIKIKKEQFKKSSFIQDIEQECENIAKEFQNNQNLQLSDTQNQIISQLVKFYKDPKEFLENSFQKKFQDVINEVIINCQEKFKKELSQKIEHIKQFFEEFNQKLISKINYGNASVIFYLKQDSQLQMHQIPNFISYQRQCVTLYFKSMINRKWEFEKNLYFQEQNIVLVQNDQYILPDDIQIQLDDDTIGIINQQIKDTDEISQICVFIRQIIKQFNEYQQIIFQNEQQEIQNRIQENQIKKKQYRNKGCISKEDLIDEYLKEFKQYFMGCYDCCPLCRRLCDQNHSVSEKPNNIKHNCNSSHQFQSFGGSYTYQDNDALLCTCNEIRDHDIVEHQGEEIKWFKFKNEKFPNWEFKPFDYNDAKIMRYKNVLIWNLIGEQLCKIYQDDGIKINFKKASNDSQRQNRENTHYIIMLDESGSMNGEPWKQLMNALTNFIRKLQDNINLKQISKVSVITFNSKSVIQFKEEEPNINLVSKIKQRGGGTNFDKPLIDAYSLCQNQKIYDKLVLYFLTDGDADEPSKGIQNFINDKQLLNKIEFHSVNFKISSQSSLSSILGFKQNKQPIILQKIVDKFPNGKLSTTINSQELQDSFIKLVPNIYEQNK